MGILGFATILSICCLLSIVLFYSTAHNLYMSTRPPFDRAAQAISGSRLTVNMMIKVDPKVLKECERLGLFIRKGRGGRKTNYLGVSQWMYNQMVQAVREELAKKGLA